MGHSGTVKQARHGGRNSMLCWCNQGEERCHHREDGFGWKSELHQIDCEGCYSDHVWSGGWFPPYMTSFMCMMVFNSCPTGGCAPREDPRKTWFYWRMPTIHQV